MSVAEPEQRQIATGGDVQRGLGANSTSAPAAQRRVARGGQGEVGGVVEKRGVQGGQRTIIERQRGGRAGAGGDGYKP